MDCVLTLVIYFASCVLIPVDLGVIGPECLKTST
jgi:hypothetical protein